MPKPWYQSKTIWTNIITLAIFVLGQLAVIPDFADVSKYLVLVVAVLNIILRAVTSQPLGGVTDSSV
jgi:hypothetical protein